MYAQHDRRCSWGRWRRTTSRPCSTSTTGHSSRRALAQVRAVHSRVLFAVLLGEGLLPPLSHCKVTEWRLESAGASWRSLIPTLIFYFYDPLPPQLSPPPPPPAPGHPDADLGDGRGDEETRAAEEAAALEAAEAESDALHRVAVERLRGALLFSSVVITRRSRRKHIGF